MCNGWDIQKYVWHFTLSRLERMRESEMSNEGIARGVQFDFYMSQSQASLFIAILLHLELFRVLLYKNNLCSSHVVSICTHDEISFYETIYIFSIYIIYKYLTFILLNEFQIKFCIYNWTIYKMKTCISRTKQKISAFFYIS